MKVKTFVVNLSRRKDRRGRISTIIPSFLDVNFTSDLGLEVDGKNLPMNLFKHVGLFPWKINSDNFWWKRPLKKGEIGCALTHLHCWKYIVDKKIELSLILEDDIIFADSFDTKLQVILDKLRNHKVYWDLLYLGRDPLSKDEFLFEDIVKPGYSFGTYAYMITNKGAKKLLDTHYEESLIPADEFLSAMCTYHPRSDVCQRYKPTLNAYAVNPSLVFSHSMSNDNSDTEDSDFIE